MQKKPTSKSTQEKGWWCIMTHTVARGHEDHFLMCNYLMAMPSTRASKWNPFLWAGNQIASLGQKKIQLMLCDVPPVVFLILGWKNTELHNKRWATLKASMLMTIALTFTVLHILRGNDKPKALSWFPPQLHVKTSKRPSSFTMLLLQTCIRHWDPVRLILEPNVDPILGLHGKGYWNRLQETGALDQRGACQCRGGRAADGGAGQGQRLWEYRGDVCADRWRRGSE